MSKTIIPARKAIAVSIRAGQSIKITNTHGKQVIDFWAFNPNDSHDYLSMVHTRTILLAVTLHVGDRLYSTKRKPMLKVIEDTTRGVHDMIWSACDSERYHMQGFQGYHDNCADNMHSALRNHASGMEISDDWVPDPLNLFMNVAIDHHGSLDIRPPTSEKGQYVVLEAAADLLLVMSSCPQDMAPVNGGQPTDCEYEILNGPASLVPKVIEGASDILMSIPKALASTARPRRVKVCLSFDFDAVSHWLGTG
jgi:uncharacterized protein YcgI (DUF1989 family)